MLVASQSISRARTSVATRLGVVVTGTALAAATLLSTAPDTAHAADITAASTTTTTSTMTARQRYAAKADRLLHVVANQKGDPYRWGATGPDAFDCSGLMYFAFQRAFGRTIPRVANDQKRASKRIWHRSNLRPGDLVFKVDSGGYAYHVGVYACHGYYRHSPHSGSWVQRDKMERGHWQFGRLIRT
jgi:cell wall-associated NlpC family hydrolase